MYSFSRQVTLLKPLSATLNGSDASRGSAGHNVHPAVSQGRSVPASPPVQLDTDPVETAIACRRGGPLSEAAFGRPQDRPGGALENPTDYASAPRPSEGKWRRLDHLRTASSDKRQRSCMVRPLGTTVGIRASSRGVGVAGVMRCGKTMCPACGPRIAVERRAEIERAVTAHRERGGTVLFLTLTLRHSRADTLDKLVRARSRGWRAATGGRGWVRDRRRFGVVGFIRALEEKWSIRHGWHAHVHVLVFIDASPGSAAVGDAVAGLLPAMFDRWSAAAVKSGLRAPLLVGQEAHEVTGDDAGRLMGDYFAKQAAGTAGDSAADMAWEMSNPNGKSRGDSFTPSELLDLASMGDDTCDSLWTEYELAMKGQQTLTWSRGLRDLLELGEERSDQDIAEDEAGTVEDTVLSITARSWLKLSRSSGARYELLRIVLEDGPPAALAWLTRGGYVAVLGPHEFEREEAA